MRLPFFYGWIIVIVTFVTMAIGVNARTSFSLFFPPIVDEFGWERGVIAGAFSFGFLVSGAVSPLIGRMMDRFGPRAVMELGVALMAGGLLLAPLTTRPWHLYLTIGVMVGSGSVCLGYSGQSLFLPNWFNRRRVLAMGLAFAGVGLGSMTLLPWVQHIIEQTGWRTDRKSTRLNSSHSSISYAVFCLKKKKTILTALSGTDKTLFTCVPAR